MKTSKIMSNIEIIDEMSEELTKIIVLLEAINGYIPILDKHTTNDEFRNDIILIKGPLVRRKLTLERYIIQINNLKQMEDHYEKK